MVLSDVLPRAGGGVARGIRAAAGAVACSFLFFVVTGAATAADAGVAPRASEEEPAAERIAVTAMRFRFAPAKIRVAPGTRLEIVLSSRDVEHGFEIVGTETNVRIPQRGDDDVTVIFEAQEEGRYLFRCSHKCGAGHQDMRGVIVVK